MHQPVVTIRGQAGTYVDQTGWALARRLGASFLDSQIIEMIARVLKVPKEDVEWLETPPRSLWDALVRAAATGAMSSPILPSTGLLMTFPGWHPRIDLHSYREALEAVVRDLAWHAPVVIKGRGSQFILKDHPGTRHILLVASPAVRARRLASAIDGATAVKAERRVRQEDRGLATFIKRLFGADVWDPAHYDLTVQMDHLTPTAAAELIMRVVPGAASSAQDGGMLPAAGAA